MIWYVPPRNVNLIRRLLHTVSMNPLTILKEALRHSDTLYYLLRQKQLEYEKHNADSSPCNGKPCASHSVGQLREDLADLERHLQVLRHTSGRSLENSLSADVFDGITLSLNAIKVYIFSTLNMSSPYFLADNTTAETLQTQIAEIVTIVADIKARLNRYGHLSQLVQNVTTAFDTSLTEVATTFRNNPDNRFDDMPESIRQNVDVFRRLVQIAQNLRPNGDANLIDDRDALSHNDDGASSRSGGSDDVIGRIPFAVEAFMDEFSRHGDDHDSRITFLQQMTCLWSGWQIDRRHISYDLDEFDDMLCLGEGASATVYAAFLATDKSKVLPVAVKSRQMTTHNITDTVREVFLHLLTQHHCIVTLYGMWYPKPSARRSLIVVERMHGTLAQALQNEGKKIDKISVLCDIAAALAHLHDRGIVHGDVKPDNILVNEHYTRAKLSDLGSSRRRSFDTKTTTGTQCNSTPLYMPPEADEHGRYEITPKMDCWAFGLVMCEVMSFSGRSTFINNHHAGLQVAASAWVEGIHDSKVKVAAKACVQVEAKDRPLMMEVYLHLASLVSIADKPAVKREAVKAEVPHGGIGKQPKEEGITSHARTNSLFSNVFTENVPSLFGSTSSFGNLPTEGGAPSLFGSSSSFGNPPTEGDAASLFGSSSSFGNPRTEGDAPSLFGSSSLFSNPRTEGSIPSLFGSSSTTRSSSSPDGKEEIENQVIYPSGENQQMANRDWKPFLEKLSTNSPAFQLSSCVDITVANRTKCEMDLCRVHNDGQLHSACRVESGGRAVLRKAEEEGRVFMVVRDARTHSLRAAFPAESLDRAVQMGMNYVRMCVGFAHEVTGGDLPWPLHDVATSGQLQLTVQNSMSHGLCVLRLDMDGHEKGLIEKVAGRSEWTGKVPVGCIVVFRHSSNGTLYGVVGLPIIICSAFRVEIT